MTDYDKLIEALEAAMYPTLPDVAPGYKERALALARQLIEERDKLVTEGQKDYNEVRRCRQELSEAKTRFSKTADELASLREENERLKDKVGNDKQFIANLRIDKEDLQARISAAGEIIASQEFKKECADTPLMRDVLDKLQRAEEVVEAAKVAADELDEAYREHWKEPPEWWPAPKGLRDAIRRYEEGQ